MGSTPIFHTMKEIHTNKKGNITQAEVAYLLLRYGYDVFVPVGDATKADLIFLNAELVPKKIQVKSSNETKSGFMIDLRYSRGVKRVKKGLYSETQIDFFATTYKGILYMIPIERVIGKSTLHIVQGNFDYVF